jgi:hypothetical protein
MLSPFVVMLASFRPAISSALRGVAPCAWAPVSAIVRVGAVRVKSGEGGTMRSMHLLLQAYPHIKQGLVLYGGDLRRAARAETPISSFVFSGSLCNS